MNDKMNDENDVKCDDNKQQSTRGSCNSAVQSAGLPMAYGLGVMATCSQRCSRCLARVAGALTTAFAAVGDQEPLPYNKTYEEQVMSCDVAVQMMQQW